MSHAKLITSTPGQPHPVDQLLDYLFADKKTVYVDDVVPNADGSFEVSWCRDYTLYMGDPQWIDTHLERDHLLWFIRKERLNHWESFRYDEQTGCIQPFTNFNPDLETFLDENFREVITEYMAALPIEGEDIKTSIILPAQKTKASKAKTETFN